MQIMKKKGNIKNVIIVILCITIISMAIGYMVLSMSLEHIKAEEEIFDVRFTSFRMMSSVKGGEKDPISNFKIESKGKILDMNFQLFKEHDEVDYEATIKNEGTVEASIVSLFVSPNYRDSKVLKDISPLMISISDISGKILGPGEETTIKITAIYNTGSKQKEGKKELNGQIGIIAESK